MSTQNEGSEIWAVSWRPGGLEGVVPAKDFVSGGEEQLVRYVYVGKTECDSKTDEADCSQSGLPQILASGGQCVRVVRRLAIGECSS